MKPNVTMVLIIGGIALICVPPLMDYLHELNAVRVLESMERGSQVSLAGRLSTEYRFGCFVMGSLMIGIGVLGSLVCGNRSREPAQTPEK